MFAYSPGDHRPATTKNTSLNSSNELKAAVWRFERPSKPPVAQIELAALMSSAAILVLPSLSDGLGRVILEPMATGIGVIDSGVGGIPDLVQEGVTGFVVPPGDTAALADEVRLSAVHPEAALSISVAGVHGDPACGGLRKDYLAPVFCPEVGQATDGDFIHTDHCEEFAPVRSLLLRWKCNTLIKGEFNAKSIE